jgi:predicted RNA-binding Zn-ribbon protein involved in translation (DUF1610 family)
VRHSAVLTIGESVTQARPVSGTSAVPPATAIILVVIVVAGCALYANLSTLVRNPINYKFFPPFEAWRNANMNNHLGAEYYNIAGALIAGRGCADPFRDETGPTAWMAPVLPCILAALRWLTGDDRETVIALVVLLQSLSLIVTGVLALALVRKVGGSVWLGLVLFDGGLAFYFRLCFQVTHDCWLVLLTLDLLIAGCVWWRPFEASWRRALLWGVFGGFCALVSPVLGFTWALMALATGVRGGRRGRLAFAVAASILAITPWVIRNYLIFGRLIPVKSNLAYELYQAQCLDKTGVLRSATFATHPYGSNNAERRLYAELGEMAFVDQKWELFREAVRANPMDFVERVANRLLAVTVVYMPHTPEQENRHAVRLWLRRIAHPLPFACWLFLLLSALWRPLQPAQWIVLGGCACYLLPYVLVSYYDRYRLPTLALEVVLCAWALERAFRMMFVRAAPAEVAEAVDEPDVVDAEPETGQAQAGANGHAPPALSVIRFACPSCGKQLMVRADAAGRLGKCARCAAVFTAPTAPAAPPTDPLPCPGGAP